MDKNNDETIQIPKELDDILAKCKPYKRYIMIGGFIILIFLVVYMGYIYGSAATCDQLDGVLDEDLVCHPGLKIQPLIMDNSLEEIQKSLDDIYKQNDK